jgi:hypothetical protein
MSNYNFTLFVALCLSCCSCGTFEEVNIATESPETPPTIEDNQDEVPEVPKDTESSTEDDLDRQPQYSSDKLWKGMSMDLVLDLFGTPDSIEDDFQGLRWIYGYDLEFCASDNRFIDCEIHFSRDVVSDQKKIDPEWMHVTSF